MERTRKVVIVDDDKENREALATALEWGGFSVSEAQDGLDLISSMTAVQPDAVLLDVTMSWINGVDLCAGIKRNESLRQIPVVFVSGRRSPADVAKGLAAGAADYFTKPVDIDRLLRRLNELTISRQ